MAAKKTTPAVALQQVRNIGVAAHIDAGKTTLSERILFYTGACHRIGEVHDGAAHMDFMAEERAHGITIGSAVTHCPWQGHLIQLVDTPGHVDFTIEVERAMRVLDGAVIVLDGVRGVEPQTETVWRQASRFDIPRLIFVNKMDRPGADYERSLASVVKRLRGNPVPVCVPTEDQLVLDLVHQQAWSFTGDRGEIATAGPIPPEHQATFEHHRQNMLLAAAEEDDDLADAVLEEAEVDPEALLQALRKGCLAGRFQPVFGGSALRNWGVQPLLDGVLALLPNPLERPPSVAETLNGAPERVEMTADGSLVALAFKVQRWDGRRHVFVRVYRGRLAPGDKVALSGKDKVERVARVFDVDANAKKAMDSAQAGQICLLAGLREATTGDTLSSPGAELLLEPIELKEPVLGLAIEASSTQDEEKLLDVLAKLCEEDPTLRFDDDEETGQRILKGMGELHLQIIFERIQREFNLSVRAGKPRVMTRETVAGPGRAQCLLNRLLNAGEDDEILFKAQASASVRPRPRDAGIEQRVEPLLEPAGAHLNAAQQEAIRAGVDDAIGAGPVEGAPLQDLAVSLDGLTLFPEGSTPQALRIVAAQAVREAIQNAGGQLLRPIMAVEVAVPEENLGTVLGDLQSRAATIMGQENDLGQATIRGECPLQALLGYTTELRSLTRGRGQFTMEFARFDVG